MKMVIWNSCGTWCYTTAKNYNSYVWNARLVHRMPGFTPEDIIEYLCKHTSATVEDFTIIY